jgi:hypothetical protein
MTDRYIEALNTRNPDQVMELYSPNAVHITANRTIQGTNAIRGWYNDLFNRVLPNAQFALSGYTGTNTTRHMTWTATSPAGSVLNGNDTLGLSGERIAYHYTFFTTTR